MMKPSTFRHSVILILIGVIFLQCGKTEMRVRSRISFNKDWKFNPGDAQDASLPGFEDTSWRPLNLPHDWSIEGEFSPDHPATPGGGALPGGIGWYRKRFTLPQSDEGKCVFVDFDGIYMNSEVWINGHSLGKRPSGYISFRYDLTHYLKYGEEANVLAVRVDNSLQPNSRWYSGSGIYRNVWLTRTDSVHVGHWGTYVTTPVISENSAEVHVNTLVRNASQTRQNIVLENKIFNAKGKLVAESTRESMLPADSVIRVDDNLHIKNPVLWSTETPVLYTLITVITSGNQIRDDYESRFGIRFFDFDADKGFSLNGEFMKIKGVCLHHDLGCLGAAVNTRAIERQLEIMKEMGVNSIRTSHNPPAPELLDLCDRMGILVQDEIFDMWKKNKSPYDYSLYWDEWHEQDLRDFIRRDRNHPSVITWSIGNEILEQWDSTGTEMARELAGIVRELDSTRPITSGCNDPQPQNFIIKSGVLDLIGYNYKHELFEAFPDSFPGQKFIAAETNSGLSTRGYYDMPSDSVRRWPERWDKPFLDGNPDNTCSAYDNCCTPWGSTHEETWKIVRKHDFLSGIYIWTGFDYLGEPTPYGWPSRSAYFGLVDLAGFPKDSYYFYQSEWTDDPVLHIFPHWNWEEGDSVDVWAYTNFEEVELFLNGMSRGIQKKTDDRLHMQWRLAYTPGTLRAVARTSDETIREIRTAGAPSVITLDADRDLIRADGQDLSFVTVRIRDASGNVCPLADNPVRFTVEGAGILRAVDNGLQTSHESFQSDTRKAFNGLCLAVIQSTETPGPITLHAESEGLKDAVLILKSR